MNVVNPSLPVWLLTLPRVTDPDNDPSTSWEDPDTWPGDWQVHSNRYAMVVAAASEAEARILAAEDDCAIWREPAYSRCEPLAPDQAGVVISVGGSAENE